MKKAMMGALMIFMASSGTFADDAATPGTASVQVMNEQLSISSTSGLNFGTILSGAGGGHVVVTPDNERRVHGKLAVSDTDSFSRASFHVHGKPNEAYSILLPKRFELTAEKGKEPLGVSQLSSKSENAGSLGRKKHSYAALDASGQDMLHIGARLRVPKHFVPGTYRGELPVTVSY